MRCLMLVRRPLRPAAAAAAAPAPAPWSPLAVLLLLLCGLAALSPAWAAASEGHDSGDAVELNQDSFDDYVKGRVDQGTACLVMFHVDWCKVCQKTFPKFAAASSLVTKREIKMNFAHVDCTNDKSLCQRFQVKGYPTIKLFQPGGDYAEPVQFRSQRSEEGFAKYAERMTQPPVRQFDSKSDFERAMSGELFSAFLLAADSSEAAPAGFAAAAEKWRDRHVFASSKSLADLLPEGAEAPPSGGGARMAVLALGSQLWPGADNKSKPSPAIKYFDGDLEDVEAVGEWVAKHRFPGIWSLSDSNFYEFTHSGQRVAMVAVDPTQVSRTQERTLRGAAERLGVDYYFGVVDGVAWAEELADFNIASSDLPRVLVAEQDFEGWFEDKERLNLESLDQELRAIADGTSEVLRQSRDIFSRLMFYKREGMNRANQLYEYGQRGPMELAIAITIVASIFAALGALGYCMMACGRVLLEDDFDTIAAREQQERLAASARHAKND